jgi:hypothetical protein
MLNFQFFTFKQNLKLKIDKTNYFDLQKIQFQTNRHITFKN